MFSIISYFSNRILRLFLVFYRNEKYRKLLHSTKYNHQVMIMSDTIIIRSWIITYKLLNNIPNIYKEIEDTESIFTKYDYLPSSVTKLHIDKVVNYSHLDNPFYHHLLKVSIKLNNLPNNIKIIQLKNLATINKIHSKCNIVIINNCVNSRTNINIHNIYLEKY